MLYLLGFDLLTGVFTLTPLAVFDKRPGATWGGVMRNWGLVFTGNFAGALTVAFFMAIIFTFGFSEAPNAVGQKIGHIGEGRTLGYAEHGAAGMLTLFERLRPLAIGSVSAAFPVVLQQEFDRTLQKHIKSKHTKHTKGTRSRS